MLSCLFSTDDGNAEGGKVAVEGNGKEGEKSKDDVTIELHAEESSRNLPWYIVDVVMRISSDL